MVVAVIGVILVIRCCRRKGDDPSKDFSAIPEQQQQGAGRSASPHDLQAPAGGTQSPDAVQDK